MKLPLVILASGLVIAGSFSATVCLAQEGTSENQGEQRRAPATPGWPREVVSQGVLMTIYEPQVDEWQDSRVLKARAAFVMRPGEGNPVVGVMEISGETTTDLTNRTVVLPEAKLLTVRFPSLPAAEVPATEALFRKIFPRNSLTLSLDRVIAGVKQQAKPLPLKMEPPRIVMSEQPALLLHVDGKPVLASVSASESASGDASQAGQFVVNANWDVFFDPAGATYYLLGGSSWYSTQKLDGEWKLETKLPAFLSSLPEGPQWEHVKKAIPAKVERGQEVASVLYSSEPAELIVFAGSPVWESTGSGGLMWARNSESRVFSLDDELYFLTSGRWFRARGWESPWSYAGNDLPEEFGKIPADSSCAEVLASVPGTNQASDAILLAAIPREAVVNVKEAEEKAAVAYSGEPDFQSIEGTEMTYAVNTNSDVIHVENHYYLCQSGVWFVSRIPTGSWEICTTVPEVIYTIPVSSPVYRVVYVTASLGDSPDVVICRYTSGYEGAYIAGAGAGTVLMWGTGYYYPPYVARGVVAPVYYPWPATYGAAAVYNPWNGGYAVGGRYYGPYGSAGSAAWYNPATGNYGRGARVNTPYGSSTFAAGYNPRTDTGWATRQNYNGYTQWGTSAVQRGDDWLRTGHAVNENGGVVGWQGSEGGGHAWKTENHSGGSAHHDGNFYTGHDGNVYRRDDNGDWAKYDDGDWESVDGPKRPEQSSALQGTEGKRSDKRSDKGRSDQNRSGSERRGGESAQQQGRGSRTGSEKPTGEQRTRPTQDQGQQDQRNRQGRGENRTTERTRTEGEPRNPSRTQRPPEEGTQRPQTQPQRQTRETQPSGERPRQPSQQPQAPRQRTAEGTDRRGAGNEQRRTREESVTRPPTQERSRERPKQHQRETPSRRPDAAREQRPIERVRESGGGGEGRRERGGHGGREERGGRR